MGTSTDAIFYFGVDLGEETPWIDEENEDDEHDGIDYDDWLVSLVGFPQWSPGDEDYWSRRREVEATIPIEIHTHCSYDYPLHFVCICGTRSLACRGESLKVDTTPPSEEQIERAQEFCKEHGIPFDGPCWQIVSMGG